MRQKNTKSLCYNHLQKIALGRSDRKHDPSRDQPASKEQRDLLAGGERGRRVCLARVASLRSLGDDANAAARCDGA